MARRFDKLEQGRWSPVDHAHSRADEVPIEGGPGVHDHDGVYSPAVHTHPYADEVHTHVEAEITDLGSYAADVHSHVEADISDLNHVSSVDDLTDVDTSTTPPTDGQALVYDDGAGLWVPGDVAAGGGGGGGTPILLGEVVLTAPAVSMAIDDIPAGYGDLMIVAQLRSSRVSDNDTVHIRFGGASIDTGSNYDYRRVWDGSGEGMDGGDSATTIQLVAQVSAASSQAGYFGQVHGTIAAYDNPATFRHALFRTMHRRGGTTFYTMDTLGVWKNTTDALQRMLLWINDGATDIDVGSFVRVYGMNGSAGGDTGAVTPIPPNDASLVANLLVWLDADQLTGLIDGDTVSPWPDESANGNDFTVVTGTPQYKTGIINGLPVVRFTTAGMASPASLLSAEPFSIFYVYAPTGTRRALQGSNNWLLGPYDGTGEDAWYSGGWADDLIPGATWRVHGVTQPASGTGYHFNRPIGAAAPTFPQSSVSVQSAGRANPGVPGTLNISRGGSFSGEGCNMDLAELIVFDRELTYDEGIGLIQYLVNKYEA